MLPPVQTKRLPMSRLPLPVKVPPVIEKRPLPPIAESPLSVNVPLLTVKLPAPLRSTRAENTLPALLSANRLSERPDATSMMAPSSALNSALPPPPACR